MVHFEVESTDQELDPESGLYNYGARMYDPMIGRFISTDTIVPRPFDPQSLNRYSYARNNPLIYVDPSGHEDGDLDDTEGVWGVDGEADDIGDAGYTGGDTDEGFGEDGNNNPNGSINNPFTLEEIVVTASIIPAEDTDEGFEDKSFFGISYNHSLFGKGKSIPNSNKDPERYTYSAFDLGGVGITFSFGNQPSENDIVSSINMGLGEYLGIGQYQFGRDQFGNPYGGIDINIGVGIGTPISIGGSMVDNSNVKDW